MKFLETSRPSFVTIGTQCINKPNPNDFYFMAGQPTSPQTNPALRNQGLIAGLIQENIDGW